MGDPAFLQKKAKTSSNPAVGRRTAGVEAVVYTGTSAAMMDLVKQSEPSLKQQPGELFRRIRPTTVANFVEQQVMEQRRQEFGGMGEGGSHMGEGAEALAQYRHDVVPLDEHRDMVGGGMGQQQQQQFQQQQQRGGYTAEPSTSHYGSENVYRHNPDDDGGFVMQPYQPSPPRQQQQQGGRAGSSAGASSSRGGGGGLLQGPQGGLVYIDRTAGGAQRPPSRTSTAGDPRFYNNTNGNANASRSGSSRGVPANVVTPLAHYEHRDANTVARYNNTIASSLRPDNSEVSRTGTARGGQQISSSVIVQGPIRRPLPRAPALSAAQQQQQQQQQYGNEGGGDDEAPVGQRQMLILDVRDKDDYDRCHIIGALHFPQIRLAHATNPYSLPEILRFKNKPNHIIVLYDLEEEITVAKRMGNVFFEKGADNVFVMAGGLREFVQTHNHLIVGECPVPIVAKSSRLGAYGADKSTLGSYANRSVAGGGGGVGAGSRVGTGVGGGAGVGRRANSSTRAGGSTVGGGSRVPVGLSSSLARR